MKQSTQAVIVAAQKGEDKLDKAIADLSITLKELYGEIRNSESFNEPAEVVPRRSSKSTPAIDTDISLLKQEAIKTDPFEVFEILNDLGRGYISVIILILDSLALFISQGTRLMVEDMPLKS